MGCSTTVSAATSCKNFWPGISAGFLEGGEKVFYYGGPGLRYFRAHRARRVRRKLSRLSLACSAAAVVVSRLFRRFLPERWSLALILLFVAVPIGTLFGTSSCSTSNGRARDLPIRRPISCSSAGILPSSAHRGPAEISAGIFRRAVARACHLHEADRRARRRGTARRRRACRALSSAMAAARRHCASASCRCSRWRCTTGSIGHVFVLFSANSRDSNLLVMPPSAYAGGGARTAEPGFQRRRPGAHPNRQLAERPGGILLRPSRSMPPASPSWSMSSCAAAGSTPGCG